MIKAVVPVRDIHEKTSTAVFYIMTKVIPFLFLFSLFSLSCKCYNPFNMKGKARLSQKEGATL